VQSHPDKLVFFASAIGLVVKDLLGLLWRLSPNVVFLSETKCSKAKINSISSRLGDFTGVVADAQGRDGSIGLLWDEYVNSLLKQSCVRF